MRRRRSPRLPLCTNLVQNHSFEAGFDNWRFSGPLSFATDQPFAGNQAVRMLAEACSLWQDISLADVRRQPLFLSFNLFASFEAADLIVEVLWLSRDLRAIGTGRYMFIGAENFTGELNAKLTVFEITDSPPANAAFARLQFSKHQGQENSFIEIDQIVLAPIQSINLVQNHGFESGLTTWSVSDFVTDWNFPLEGGAYARGEGNGSLTQEVDIAHEPPRSSYLLSFALSLTDTASVETTVRVQWLDRDGNIISDGLQFFIPQDSLLSRSAYLTYLAVTSPAPQGAVRARIRFENQGAGVFDYRVDQVLFSRILTPNLVHNSSFEDGLNGWEPENVGTFNVATAYEGNVVATMTHFGASLAQQIPITRAVGRCYLLNFAMKVARIAEFGEAALMVKVIWLDRTGREIGLGLGLVARGDHSVADASTWLVYAAITEPAPPGTAAAKVQFTMPSSENADLFLDHVVFAQL